MAIFYSLNTKVKVFLNKYYKKNKLKNDIFTSYIINLNLSIFLEHINLFYFFGKFNFETIIEKKRRFKIYFI